MAEEPTHPITTPKGASAVTILLGVVSVFTPFLFNLESALMFGVMAIIVIGWIYWAEAKAAIVERCWNAHLNVPLTVIVAIIMIGAISARNVARAPTPVPTAPAISADEIAGRVEAIWARDHPQTAVAQPTAAAFPARPYRVVINVPPLSVTSASSPQPSPKTTESPIEAVIEANRRNVAAANAARACTDTLLRTASGLEDLIAEAAIDQNSYHSTQNDGKIKQDYYTWVGRVSEFFSDHKSILPDTSEFEKAHGSPTTPTLLLIHNSGIQTWRNFDAKRVALININNAYVQTACTPTKTDAVVQQLKNGSF